MENLIGIFVVLLIVLFIYKVGSAIWRLLGVLLLIGFIWFFWDSIINQVNHWLNLIGSEGFLNQVKHFFSTIWQSLVSWFGGLAN